MYSNLHFRFSLPNLSAVVDTASFHLDYFASSSAADITDVSDLCNFLITSLNTVPSGATNAPDKYLSQSLSRSANACLVDVYDVTTVLSGGRMGSPVLISSFTLGGTPGIGACPETVAVGITLQAPYGTDVEFGPGTRPRARDRGRIYFGPASSNALATESVTGRTIIASTCQTDLCQWIKAINEHTTATHSIPYNLCVWSRKNAIMKSLQEVWIDDRPDVVRLRYDQGLNRKIVGLP